MLTYAINNLSELPNCRKVRPHERNGLKGEPDRITNVARSCPSMLAQCCHGAPRRSQVPSSYCTLNSGCERHSLLQFRLGHEHLNAHPNCGNCNHANRPKGNSGPNIARSLAASYAVRPTAMHPHS